MTKEERRVYARSLHKLRKELLEVELAKSLLDLLTEKDPLAPFELNKVPVDGLVGELKVFLHKKAEKVNDLHESLKIAG